MDVRQADLHRDLLPQSGHLRVTAALGLWHMQHSAFLSAQVVLPSIQKQWEPQYCTYTIYLLSNLLLY